MTAVGTVVRADRGADRLVLAIRSPYDDLAVGDSVAVNGACLTVVEHDAGTFRVDVIVTTRGRTVLEALGTGDRVNLERALAVGDRLGGHFVQGHIDGVGDIVDLRECEDAWLMDIRLPPEVAELSIPHGSIAIDGVSLTISEMVGPATVQIGLIPFTMEHTTLGERTIGDRVQVEADMLGKYVRQLVRTG
ncbi:MAG: riboflavin synthase [Gemmatimonadota bacterium]|nr:riboflavin synthase [Gemmatimonadota bacterium]